MEMTDKKTEIEQENLSSVAGGEEELKEIPPFSYRNH